LCSCSRSYSFQAFSYPPGSKPHETNWTYLLKVISWDPRGMHPVERGKRDIDIIINDKTKNTILEDKIELESASIRSEVRWTNFERLTLDIYEVGNEYANDSYNKKRIAKGRKLLKTLIYVWDGKKYIRHNTEPIAAH
jgi:hypothetical protein